MNSSERDLRLSEEPGLRRTEMTGRILDEAERLFRHYGYTKTTVADIARELGMSPANVYRFFSSKTQIHEALAERILAQREVALHAIAKRAAPASERLRAYVLDEYEFTVSQMLDETKVHEMVAVALDQHWPMIDRHLQRITDIISWIIADGMAAGEFAAGDPAKAARCLKACFISFCHPAVVAQCRLDPGNVSPGELADFVLRALKP